MSASGTTLTELGSAPTNQPVRPAHGRVISLSEALNGTNNSLGLIRLVLAALVIFDHAFPLGGWGHDPFWNITNGQASLGSIAVAGFFAISGYLITKSGMSGDVVQFMWRRTLRIFPAYWLVLLVTALIVAPLLWALQGRDLAALFTEPGGPVHYLLANWSFEIGAYGINDLLAETTPYGLSVGASVFNGSLWTLIYEWHCYLMIAVLVGFGVMRYSRVIIPLVAAGFLIMQIVATIAFDSVATLLPLMADPQRISLGFTFMLGAVLAVYSKQVPFDDRLGILAGIILLVSLRLGGYSTIGTVAGAYFVMYLAARLPRQLQWIGRRNDYSYGVYIYGFLVQQVGAHFGVHHLGYAPYVAISLVVSFMLAWLSWHAIEKWAMRLKDWGPGRGARFWYERSRERVRSTSRQPSPVLSKETV